MGKKHNMVRRGICLPVLIIVIGLTCLGLVMVLNSSYINILLKNSANDYYSSFRTQLLVAIVGVVVMLFLCRRNYHMFGTRIFIGVLYVLSVVMLIMVFFFHSMHDSHRWIEVGSITIQPSEVGKLTGILYASAFVSKKKWWYRSLRDVLMLLVPIGILAVLILVEPDLSTTLSMLGSIALIMFVSGLPWGWMLGGIAAIGSLVPIMIFFTKYQKKRFDAWLYAWSDPKGNGYQVVQSLYAIGDGGLFGVGLGNSKQKITHLPMSDTDYIFSIICEEFGFVGAVIVVAAYVALAVLGIRIAMNAPDSFGSYAALGITSMIVLQAFINMGVATNVLPSTGVTLPFISKGASSLGVMLAAAGILLSISAYRPHVRKGKETEKQK